MDLSKLQVIRSKMLHIKIDVCVVRQEFDPAPDLGGSSGLLRRGSRRSMMPKKTTPGGAPFWSMAQNLAQNASSDLGCWLWTYTIGGSTEDPRWNDKYLFRKYHIRNGELEWSWVVHRFEDGVSVSREHKDGVFGESEILSGYLNPSNGTSLFFTFVRASFIISSSNENCGDGGFVYSSSESIHKLWRWADFTSCWLVMVRMCFLTMFEQLTKGAQIFHRYSSFKREMSYFTSHDQGVCAMGIELI